MKMSEYFNLFDFNDNSLCDCKIKQLVDLMEKKYVSYWNHTVQHSRKLSFYLSIKKNHNPSAYLDSTRKNPMRRTLVKLRIGCHNGTYVLKRVGTTKSLSMKRYVPSVELIKLRTKPISYLSYEIVRDILR